MEMKPVTSSQIHAIGYDPAAKKLHVQFFQGKGADRGPGPIYEYDDITPDQHSGLVGAESIGSHFGKHIKNNTAIKFRRL